MTRIFVDFEMNNTDGRFCPPAHLRQEIIEIGAVRMDEQYRVVDSFCCRVQPAYNSVIAKNIFRLTGISSGDVRGQKLLAQALADFEAWCGEGLLHLCTWSENDLAQLRRECAAKGIESPLLTQSRAHWHDFQRVYGRVTGQPHKRVALAKALEAFSLQPEGMLHDARDDAANCAHLMELAHSGELQRRQKALNRMVLHDAPAVAMGGLPAGVRAKLLALLAECPSEAVPA